MWGSTIVAVCVKLVRLIFILVSGDCVGITINGVDLEILLDSEDDY